MEQCKGFFEGLGYEIKFNLVPAGASGSESLFGVSDYLAAFALLLVIYTISDYRNKLRLSLAPFPIYKLGFWIFLCVFFVKAIVELWFFQSWPIFPALDNKSLIDTVLLTPCILAVFYGIYISYIRPPVFSRWNCNKFFWVYQKVIHNGTEEELRIALNELTRSAQALIKAAVAPPFRTDAAWSPTPIQGAAHNFLLLMGNRRMCSEMAKNSPDTAATFFREVSKQEKLNLPFGMFAQNISASFLTDKSSPIFHEDSGRESGWSGYAQLYSSEIFANPKLVSALAQRHSSPLDVRYSIRKKWDAENWEAYGRVSLLYFERILEESPNLISDYSVYEILESFKIMSSGIYRVNGVDGAFHEMDEYRKLTVLSEFISDFIKLLDKYKVPISSSVKPKDKQNSGIHERLAELIFELIYNVASVRYPAWTCWDVTHNTVWAKIFSFIDSKTRRWVFHRVCRLMYDEIRHMDEFFNFKGAAYFGFCLNVLGLSEDRRHDFGKKEVPLRLATLNWARKNYSRMKEESPKVAQACLHGSITFDDNSLEFVRTYSNETGKSPKETRFKVDSLRTEGLTSSA